MDNATLFQKRLLGIRENMMNLALLLTANKEDAKDLFQDTTLRVLDNEDKFTDNVNFKGWVLTVMRNTFINNYHRVVRTQTIMDQGADIYNVDTVNHSGFDTADGACDLQEINGAIESLSDEMRVPFSLYVSGYKYEEIADKLEIPVGTVKSRIFTARKDLQNKLKDFYTC